MASRCRAGWRCRRSEKRAHPRLTLLGTWRSDVAEPAAMGTADRPEPATCGPRRRSSALHSRAPDERWGGESRIISLHTRLRRPVSCFIAPGDSPPGSRPPGAWGFLIAHPAGSRNASRMRHQKTGANKDPSPLKATIDCGRIDVTRGRCPLLPMRAKTYGFPLALHGRSRSARFQDGHAWVRSHQLMRKHRYG